MSQVKAVQLAQQQKVQPMDADKYHRDFHGAAIIDENGKEVPITEEMIQQACNDLSNAWLFPRQTHKH